MDVIGKSRMLHLLHFFLDEVKVTQKQKLYIKNKTNRGQEISQIRCKFSVHYLVYNNYKLISEAAIGKGFRKLRILRILKLRWELN